MTTAAGTLAPACRIGEHDECSGPVDIRRDGAPPWEAPIERLRCDCACHRR